MCICFVKIVRNNFFLTPVLHSLYPIQVMQSRRNLTYHNTRLWYHTDTVVDMSMSCHNYDSLQSITVSTHALFAVQQQPRQHITCLSLRVRKQPLTFHGFCLCIKFITRDPHSMLLLFLSFQNIACMHASELFSYSPSQFFLLVCTFSWYWSCMTLPKHVTNQIGAAEMWFSLCNHSHHLHTSPEKNFNVNQNLKHSKDKNRVHTAKLDFLIEGLQAFLFIYQKIITCY